MESANRAITLPEGTRSALAAFLSFKKKATVIALDLETNGLEAYRSVLCAAGLLFEVDRAAKTIREIARFVRFYYPIEAFNPDAIRVNGLTAAEIDRRRADAAYPRFFKDDAAFADFCRGTARYVGHNIAFDRKFLRFLLSKKHFCTMMTNREIVGIPSLKYSGFKYPSLAETARRWSVPYEEAGLHDGLKDAELAAGIFCRMVQAWWA